MDNLAKIKSVVTRMASCPSCGDDDAFNVTHIGPGGYPMSLRAGPWFCDECGYGVDVRYDADSGSIFLPPADGDRKFSHNGIAVVCLPPQDEPVYFTVDACGVNEEDEEDGLEAHRYWYEEGTCPTNFLRYVHQVRIGDDNDPHGLFELVSLRRGKFEKGD